MRHSWAIQWRTGGEKPFLLGCYYSNPPKELEGCPVLLFRTREQARTFIKNRFGFIKDREDLIQPPHCWRMPKVKKVYVNVSIASEA